MDISLKDQIVVLDEAHNVEDSARDAASLTLTAVELQNALDDLDRLGDENNQSSSESKLEKTLICSLPFGLAALKCCFPWVSLGLLSLIKLVSHLPRSFPIR